MHIVQQATMFVGKVLAMYVLWRLFEYIEDYFFPCDCTECTNNDPLAY